MSGTSHLAISTSDDPIEAGDIVSDAGGTVTVFIRRHPKPDRIAEFEAVLTDTIDAALKFPGHLGVTVLRPKAGEQSYLLITRFVDAASLDAWRKSDIAADFFARLALIETTPRREVDMSGMSAWFNDPAEQPGNRPTLRALVTLGVGAWLTITVLLFIFGPTFSRFALPLQTALLVVLMVPTLTYIVMPRLHAALRWISRRRSN